MIYPLFRWLTGIALHWFYSSIHVIGKERIPTTGPFLLAASHHNALVDALIAVWVSPRRLTLTAKATLMENPILALLMRSVSVVPLRRVSDEQKRSRFPDAERNAGAFRSLMDVLARGEAILIFPEGKSHSEPALAPLRTGVARIALEAKNQRGISGMQIIPLGLSFEDKGNPGTSVLAEVGSPLLLDYADEISVDELTGEVARRLAAVSLRKPAPSPDRDAVRRKGNLHPLASPLAAWGELTHRYLINWARDLAVKRSRSPDDPAMLTIVFSLVFILASYVVQFVAITLLAGPAWAFAYIATLPASAYWAAYKAHPRA